MKNEEILKCLEIMQRSVEALRNGTLSTEKGTKWILLANNPDGVHVSSEAFAELSQGRKIGITNLDSDAYPYQLSFEFNGLKFYALFTEEKMSELFKEAK